VRVTVFRGGNGPEKHGNKPQERREAVAKSKFWFVNQLYMCGEDAGKPVFPRRSFLECECAYRR
jgi:hypothetical protein